MSTIRVKELARKLKGDNSSDNIRFYLLSKSSKNPPRILQNFKSILTIRGLLMAYEENHRKNLTSAISQYVQGHYNEVNPKSWTG